MKLTTIIGAAIALVGLAACGSTATPTVRPSTQTPTIAPTVAPTVAPTLAPTVAPTLTPTVAPTPTPTATPVPPTHAVVTAQTTCDGAWRASVALYGFSSDVLYTVSVTNNLFADFAPYSGVPFGPGGVNPTPADGTIVWGTSGKGFHIGDSVTVTISPDDGYTTTATIQAPLDCPTPKLTVTTACAFPGAFPDGYVAFTGGIEGMLFEIYGPETKGSFPLLGPLETDATGGANDGSIGAGSYEYAYVVPDSGPGTIDGSFTVAACATSVPGTGVR